MRSTCRYICVLGLLTSASWTCSSAAEKRTEANAISVSTDFMGGGGSVKVVSSNPAVIRFEPHDEGTGGTGAWFYFKVEGVAPLQEITLQLDSKVRKPTPQRAATQIRFSYDQKTWGFTDSGAWSTIDGESLFVYKHRMRGRRIWFALDLPYTPEHVDDLISEANRDPGVEVFELGRTKANGSVKALRFKAIVPKYGIWLQARSHAFESGSSWVLGELARWLLSNDPAARSLRGCASITVVPIVDVDGVVEGRTGKARLPYDQTFGWDEEPGHWPEVRAIKATLREMAKDGMVDLFLDLHTGIAWNDGLHPFFIGPQSDLLKGSKQQHNQTAFLAALKTKPQDKIFTQTTSMTEFYHSLRSREELAGGGVRPEGGGIIWVARNCNEQTVALSLEVQSGRLSSRAGYQDEAVMLGRGIAEYFVGNRHDK